MAASVYSGATSPTLLSNSLRLDGAGLSIASGVTIAGSNGKQAESFSLNAGSGDLTLLSTPAAAAKLRLRGKNLILPANSTSKLFANDLDLDSGLLFKANQSLLNGLLELSIRSDAYGVT
jgi:hypothetical protein